MKFSKYICFIRAKARDMSRVVKITKGKVIRYEVLIKYKDICDESNETYIIECNKEQAEEIKEKFNDVKIIKKVEDIYE